MGPAMSFLASDWLLPQNEQVRESFPLFLSIIRPPSLNCHNSPISPLLWRGYLLPSFFYYCVNYTILLCLFTSHIKVPICIPAYLIYRLSGMLRKDKIKFLPDPQYFFCLNTYIRCLTLCTPQRLVY